VILNWRQQANELIEFQKSCKWPYHVSTLSELLRKAAAGSENEAGAEQVG
jgi:hypothetical protein